jgi:hypothetical protein
MEKPGRHIYLVTLGLSQHHGSELSVGWQWYCRLVVRGPTTVLTHCLFNDARFLDAQTQSHCVFLGRKLAHEDAFNRFHPLYAFAFWRACRRYLRHRLTPEDRVLIVTPAALWFFPMLGKLSRQREQFYYGPLGGELLPANLLISYKERAQAHFRNALSKMMLVLWRVLAARLPAQVSFRTPSTERIFPTTSFGVAGIVPEVEISTGVSYVPMTRTTRPEASETVLVMLDERLRKNTLGNLKVATSLACQGSPHVVVLGTSTLAMRYKPQLANIARHVLQEPMERCDFLSFLQERQPSVIALSLSEGVPGYLLEALSAGCWVLTYPVGGVSWLVECAAEVIAVSEVASLPLPGEALWLRWDTASCATYQRKTSAGLSALMERETL